MHTSYLDILLGKPKGKDFKDLVWPCLQMHFIASWPSFLHLEDLHMCNLHRDRTPQLQPTSDFTDLRDCMALFERIDLDRLLAIFQKCSEVLGVKLHLLELHLHEAND